MAVHKTTQYYTVADEMSSREVVETGGSSDDDFEQAEEVAVSHGVNPSEILWQRTQQQAVSYSEFP